MRFLVFGFLCFSASMAHSASVLSLVPENLSAAEQASFSAALFSKNVANQVEVAAQPSVQSCLTMLNVTSVDNIQVIKMPKVPTHPLIAQEVSACKVNEDCLVFTVTLTCPAEAKPKPLQGPVVIKFSKDLATGITSAGVIERVEW